ncbi:MAG: hypothetical protein ACRC5T_04270, partial [Cetobacterium sp.]
LLGNVVLFTTVADHSADKQNWLEDGLTSIVKANEKRITPRKMINTMNKLIKTVAKENTLRSEMGISLTTIEYNFLLADAFKSLCGACGTITREIYNTILNATMIENERTTEKVEITIEETTEVELTEEFEVVETKETPLYTTNNWNLRTKAGSNEIEIYNVCNGDVKTFDAVETHKAIATLKYLNMEILKIETDNDSIAVVYKNSMRKYEMIVIGNDITVYDFDTLEHVGSESEKEEIKLTVEKAELLEATFNQAKFIGYFIKRINNILIVFKNENEAFKIDTMKEYLDLMKEVIKENREKKEAKKKEIVKVETATTGKTLKVDSNGIKVDGRKGKWYVIDKRVVKDMNGRIKTVFMLEHEFYGDEAEWIFV